jgi:putative transposase
LENEVADYIKETAKTLQMDIIAMEVMPDHIHILADCKPQLRLSDAIKVLKGNTSR